MDAGRGHVGVEGGGIDVGMDGTVGVVDRNRIVADGKMEVVVESPAEAEGRIHIVEEGVISPSDLDVEAAGGEEEVALGKEEIAVGDVDEIPGEVVPPLDTGAGEVLWSGRSQG